MATNATTTQHPGSESPNRAGPARTGFELLARRITGWTSNLVATAVILVGGLVTGRQVLEWWRADAPSPNDAAASAAEAASIVPNVDQQQHLKFGSSPHVIHREEIRGDRAAATAILARRCREVAEATTAPAGEITDAERRLLDRLEQARPSGDSASAIQVFELEDALPMIVGVRATGTESDATGQALAAKAARRVAAWGVAFPAADDRWVLFLLQPETAATRDPNSSPIKLPPGGRHVMSIGDEAGGTMTAFKGAARADDWLRFFRELAATQPWTTIEDWHRVANTWHARYRSNAASPAHSVDLQFTDDGRGKLIGLATLSPASTAAKDE